MISGVLSLLACFHAQQSPSVLRLYPVFQVSSSLMPTQTSEHWETMGSVFHQLCSPGLIALHCGWLVMLKHLLSWKKSYMQQC